LAQELQAQPWHLNYRRETFRLFSWIAGKGLDSTPRGITFQPNGLEALEKIGVLDSVLQMGSAERILEVKDWNGELLLEADYGLLEHPQNYIMMLMQCKWSTCWDTRLKTWRSDDLEHWIQGDNLEQWSRPGSALRSRRRGL